MLLAEEVRTYAAYPVNFYEVVPHLLNLYRDWSEEDIIAFVEEKTGRRVHPEDQITLRAVYRRCRRAESGFPPLESRPGSPDGQADGNEVAP